MKHGYDCPECPMFVGDHRGDKLRPNMRSYFPKREVVGGKVKQSCQYCGKLLRPLSIPAHEKKCKERYCGDCGVSFHTRDARLHHECGGSGVFVTKERGVHMEAHAIKESCGSGSCPEESTVE